MRRAHARAQTKLKTTHPFCSNRIFTDGRSILLRQGEEDSDRVLIDLANDQAEFARIVEPFRKELEFSGSDIIWWPLGKERQVVINPKRNFGQPSAARSGVPTRVLARSAMVVVLIAGGGNAHVWAAERATGSHDRSSPCTDCAVVNVLTPKVSYGLAMCPSTCC